MDTRLDDIAKGLLALIFGLAAPAISVAILFGMTWTKASKSNADTGRLQMHKMLVPFLSFVTVATACLALACAALSLLSDGVAPSATVKDSPSTAENATHSRKEGALSIERQARSKLTPLWKPS